MYKKIRYAAWFASALLKKYRVHVSVGLLIGAVSFIGLPWLIRHVAIFKPVQQIGIIGRVTSAELPLSIQRRLSIGLTTISENGTASPGLAKSWQVSEDGKTYTFTINDSLVWHDNTHVVSKDIAYSFKDVEISYPDDTHLVIKLSDPFAALPVVVSRPVFKTNTSKIIGVGKYQVNKIHNNGAFIETLTLTTPDSSLPTLKYSFFATQSIAKTAFKLGVIDSIIDVSDISDLESWSNVIVRGDARIDKYVAVFFNTQSPNFIGASGKNLRLALAYATDKSMYSKNERALGPISLSSWGYNPDIKAYDKDIAHAKDLLKKVEKIPEEITLTTLPMYLPLAERIQSDWNQVGIKSKIQVVQDIPETFEALLIAQAIPQDPDQYNLWHSTQTSTNLTQLQSPRIDKLLEDGRKTLNQKDRKKIYLDFQRYLLEESPAIFLYYPKTFSLYRR